MLLDSASRLYSHSKFFKMLNENEQQVDFELKTSTLVIKKYGEYMYDNIVLFSSATVEEVFAKELLQFIDCGGNMLIVADENLSGSMREFVDQLGIRLSTDHLVQVQDHFQYHSGLDERFQRVLLHIFV